MKPLFLILKIRVGWMLARCAATLLEKGFQGHRIGAELSAVIRRFIRAEELLRAATPVVGEVREDKLTEFFASEREWLSGDFAEKLHEEIHREDIARIWSVWHDVFPSLRAEDRNQFMRHMGRMLEGAS